MPSDRARRAAEVLLDDASRQGGALLMSQVDRVLSRRGLDPAECLYVYRILEENGIRPQSSFDEIATADAVDVPSGSATANSSDVDGGVSGDLTDDDLGEGAGGAEEEPTAEDLSRIPTSLTDHSLLSADDEKRLARTFGLGRQMAAALANGTVEETDAVLEIVGRGMEARETMIRSNLRLVLKVAYQYAQVTSLSVEDLFQEGTLGLIKAVEKFDPAKRFRFSTYAYWWIRQSITRAIADKGETIRLPVHVSDKLFRLKRAIRVLRRFNYGEFPSITQLADELNWPTHQVQFFLDLSKIQCLSLDAPVDDDEKTAFIDAIADPSPGPEEIAIASNVYDVVQDVLRELSDKEREILILRFGLDGIAERTLEEIGRRYGVTRERIRQIEAKALKKLMNPVRARRLQGLVEA